MINYEKFKELGIKGERVKELIISIEEQQNVINEVRNGKEKIQVPDNK